MAWDRQTDGQTDRLQQCWIPVRAPWKDDGRVADAVSRRCCCYRRVVTWIQRTMPRWPWRSPTLWHRLCLSIGRVPSVPWYVHRTDVDDPVPYHLDVILGTDDGVAQNVDHSRLWVSRIRPYVCPYLPQMSTGFHNSFTVGLSVKSVMGS